MGPCTGAEWIRMPVSLRFRYPSMGSIPKLKSSMANLSPCLTDILVFFTHLPCTPLTTMMEKLLSYRFLYLAITAGSRPLQYITCRHHVTTMLQKAAIRSVSRIPHLTLLSLVALMASLAIAMPWEIRLLPPDTSWRGDMVLCMAFLIRAASIPVSSLKSTLSSESFLLTDIFRLFAF